MKTLKEIFDDLGARVQEVLERDDLDVGEGSGFGRLFFPVAERFARVEGGIDALRFLGDLETQGGPLLDVLGVLRRCRRILETFSVMRVRLVGVSGTDLSGLLVESQEVRWEIPPGTVVGGAGFVDTEVVATEAGPVTGALTASWEIVTETSGWEGVEPVEFLKMGTLREDDSTYRSRIRASEAALLGTEPAIWKAVAEVEGVDAATLIVDPNRSDKKDPVTGAPPASVEVLVQGGADLEIARAIFRGISSIARSYSEPLDPGYREVSFVEETSKTSKVVFFTRPSPLRVYAVISVTLSAKWPIAADADQTLRAGLTEWVKGSPPRRELTAAQAEAFLTPLLDPKTFTDLTVRFSSDGIVYGQALDPGPRRFPALSNGPSAASFLGTTAQPFTLGAGWLVSFSINGGPPNAIMIPGIGPGATAEEVATMFGVFGGIEVFAQEGRVGLRTLLTGSGASIEILIGSTPDLLTALGWSVGTTFGRDTDIDYSEV